MSEFRTASAVMQPLWAVRYRIALVTLDLCCIIVATTFGYELRFGVSDQPHPGVGYLGTAVVITIVWIVALQSSGGYEIRHLATGPEESKRVLRASASTVSVLAIVCYASKTELARGFVVGVIPTGFVLLLIGRALVRALVRSRRETGEWSHKIVAVGTTESVLHLLEVTDRAKGSGLRIIGVCV
ncbi:hypothetical protein, partial [Jatrophihabitans sp.]|uniref:hypothetical protein n=1 Tax=Jatrophihabitans sp. TaxID=1932789 RepID=UPI0030C69AAC|nr:exopolysaccharide biosynthesis polyprenyl glycosylphosphotransferase [Jatrophihabitans sp.]